MSTLPKNHKTPLRWVGGKSRATRTLFEHFPTQKPTSYIEPFLGGGSMAIEFTRRYPDVPVFVSDLDTSVANFWMVLKDNVDDLVDSLLETKSKISKDVFLETRSRLEKTVSEEPCYNLYDASPYSWNIDFAHDFFVVNKCGFSGLMTAGFSQLASEQNFSHANIEKLHAYSEHISNWDICHQDASHAMSTALSTDLVYLDPPYAKVGKDGKSLVYRNHKDFDHLAFASLANDSTAQVLLSYDNNPVIRSLYSSWNNATFDHSYTMHSGTTYRSDQTERKELVLWNYG